MRKKVIGFVLCCIFGAVICFLICWLNHYADLESDQEKLRILCDGFTIPGVILIGASALIYVSNKGAFYGLGYGLRTAKEILLPFLPHEYVKYRDYVAKKEKKKVNGYGFVLIAGLLFLAVGIFLLIRFNVLYPDA